VLRLAVVAEADKPAALDSRHWRAFDPGLQDRLRPGLPRAGGIAGPGEAQVLLQRVAALVLEDHPPARAGPDDGGINAVEPESKNSSGFVTVAKSRVRMARTRRS
jgi:hypothetical protein